MDLVGMKEKGVYMNEQFRKNACRNYLKHSSMNVNESPMNAELIEMKLCMTLVVVELILYINIKGI